MVAVAAVSALTAIPDARASLFIADPSRGPRLLYARCAGCRRDTGRSPGRPDSQQLFGIFLRRLLARSAPGSRLGLPQRREPETSGERRLLSAKQRRDIERRLAQPQFEHQ